MNSTITTVAMSWTTRSRKSRLLLGSANYIEDGRFLLSGSRCRWPETPVTPGVTWFEHESMYDRGQPVAWIVLNYCLRFVLHRLEYFRVPSNNTNYGHQWNIRLSFNMWLRPVFIVSRLNVFSFSPLDLQYRGLRAIQYAPIYAYLTFSESWDAATTNYMEWRVWITWHGRPMNDESISLPRFVASHRDAVTSWQVAGPHQNVAMVTRRQKDAFGCLTIAVDEPTAISTRQCTVNSSNSLLYMSLFNNHVLCRYSESLSNTLDERLMSSSSLMEHYHFDN